MTYSGTDQTQKQSFVQTDKYQSSFIAPDIYISLLYIYTKFIVHTSSFTSISIVLRSKNTLYTIQFPRGCLEK